MDWIRSLYEKIKPFGWLAVMLLVCASLVTNIMGARRGNDNRATIERIYETVDDARRSIGDLLSDLSDVQGGIDGLEESVDELRRVQDELGSTVSRIEEASLLSGDQSTESGILADRLYRVNRELAERLEKGADN